MENNKDREMNRAPMEDAVENGLEEQTAQPDEAPAGAHYDHSFALCGLHYPE